MHVQSCCFANLKGHSQLRDHADPEHYFCQFENRLPQPEIKSTRQIHLEIYFNPAQCFIRSLIFY